MRELNNFLLPGRGCSRKMQAVIADRVAMVAGGRVESEGVVAA